jgi:hypothetical protein
VHASSLARTSLDLLSAARKLAGRAEIEVDPRVFIMGWSQKRYRVGNVLSLRCPTMPARPDPSNAASRSFG